MTAPFTQGGLWAVKEAPYNVIFDRAKTEI